MSFLVCLWRKALASGVLSLLLVPIVHPCAAAEFADYAAWRMAVFSAAQRADGQISGAVADPDADGLSNVMEYALASDPLAPGVALEATGSAYRFPRRTGITDFELFPEVSTNLQQWTRGAVSAWSSNATAAGDGRSQVTLSRTGAVPAREFVRLRAVRSLWLRTCHGSGGSNYIYAGVSLDGKTFEGVGKRILFGSWPNPGSQVRDPSVIFHDGKYVVAYTGDNFGRVPWFGMATSTNLLDWTQLPNVSPTGFTGTVFNIWAPEWLVDDGRYFLVFRISTTEGNFYGPPGMGFVECLDPGTWSQWTPWTPIDGIPSFWNDVCILRFGNIYHLFANNGSGSIVHAQSSSRFTGYGPGSIVSDGWRAAIGPSYNDVEGPNVVSLGGDRFRIYFQHLYTDVGYYAESSDGMQTWSAPSLIGWNGGGERPGHGTVIRLAFPEEQSAAWPHAPNSPLP